jgi:hypothetical protein
MKVVAGQLLVGVNRTFVLRAAILYDLLDRALVTATVRTQKAAFFPLIAIA